VPDEPAPAADKPAPAADKPVTAPDEPVAMRDRDVLAGGKAVPVPTPESQPFWDGCAAGELRIQRCLECTRPYFYPRPVCPACGSVRVEWFTASGRATLYSYVINHRPAPGFELDGPYAIAVVQLAEGPRLMTNLTGIPNTPDDLVLDMPLRVAFCQRGDVSLPVFAPEYFTPEDQENR
jgi:uncharacterized OB-fold protein